MNHVSVAWLTLACALGCAAALTGCIEEKCDPGFAARRGACYPTAIDSGLIGPGGGPDEDAGGDGSQAPACARGDGFGVTCVDQDDCSCGTRCIPVLKICSVLNCEATPEVCPENWQCRDISQASTDPSVTSICLASP